MTHFTLPTSVLDFLSQIIQQHTTKRDVSGVSRPQYNTINVCYLYEEIEELII